jgi:hypothetical protein
MIADFLEYLKKWLSTALSTVVEFLKWYVAWMHNGGWLALIFGKRGLATIQATLSNWIHAVVQAAPGLATELANDLQPAAQQIEAAITTVGGGIRDALEPGLASVGTAAFNTIVASLAGNFNITPDQWETIAGKMFADAAGFGLSSFAVSAAFESIFPEKLNTLNSVGPMLATLAGFEEVTKAGISPMLYAFIGQPARYDANSKARSLLPDLMTARIMLSRRLITTDQYNTLVGYAGLSPDWVAAEQALSFRPIQARALATAIVDTPFPTAQMTAILQDNGFSDTNVQFMLGILQYNSTKNVRNSYISEAITAYGDGVVGDAELNQILTSQGWSDDAITLATNRALIIRRVKLAAEVSSQVVPLITAGLMTPEQGLQQLEAAGVVDWQANLKITLATTKAELQQARKTAAAEAKLELTRQRNLTRAAVAEYERGAIDSAGLTAALVALGLDATLVASVVAVETSKRAGKLKFVYGQFLTPQAAKVLTEQVAAYEAQFKAAQIDLATVTNALASLQVPPAQAQALIADWSASAAVATPAGTKQPV